VGCQKKAGVISSPLIRSPQVRFIRLRWTIYGKVGLYRLEVGCSAGTGKLRVAGSADSTMRESIQRAFAYIQGHKVNMGIAQAFDTTDVHVEAIDLLTNRVSCDVGVALVVAIYSALKKHAALPGLLILGDLSIQGNIKAARSLAEPLASRHG
jgi:ATP-dependent Lon protease